MDYDKLVAEGAALMDKVAPIGWRDRVELKRLDMTHASYCVAGQVFGSWLFSVPDAVREHPAFGGELDFYLDHDQIVRLQGAWLDYLTPDPAL